MVDWRYLLLAQYPAFLLLAMLFLLNYLRVRARSAVKSVLWVLLFGAALAAAVLFAFFGVHYQYWELGTLFRLGLASWIGVVLIVVAAVAGAVHSIEKKRSKKLMEKELQRAAKEKDEAVAQEREAAAAAARQAHEEGRRMARQEVEAERFAHAAEAAGSEAAQSDLAREAQSPIELKLDE